MKVNTTRSGHVLHASNRCPELVGKRVFVIDETDALASAVRCTHGLCFAAFVRAGEKAEAKAA